MKTMNKIKMTKAVVAKMMGGMVIAGTAIVGMTPITAFAQSKVTECICEEKCTQDSINEECAVCLYDYTVCEGIATGTETESADTEEETYGPLTPDGNMTLVDDYGSLEAGGKQFITITTKSGNYFYLIIDRDDNGSETVHFLNLVDESDLLALMEEEEVESYMNSQGMTQKETEEPETTETTEIVADETEEEEVVPETDKTKNVTGIMALILGCALAGIGGYFYARSNAGKKKTDAPDPDADYFDSDEEDYLEDLDVDEEMVFEEDEDDDSESGEDSDREDE